tara:strand:- start:2123 stop:2743 length:621 start_codon:yes stop_codon:yes gene_type:complete
MAANKIAFLKCLENFPCMQNLQEEAISIFMETGGLLTGHFILRSGLRSGHYFQCAQVCQYLDKVGRLSEMLIEKMGDVEVDVVVAPAMGALVLGQEVARKMGKRFLFLEKVDDKLTLRRNFKLESRERVLIVEDVVTRGGRVREALDIVRGIGCEVSTVAVLVDRSGGKVDFCVPFVPLVEMNFPTYQPDSLPPELEAIPPVKPGS